MTLQYPTVAGLARRKCRNNMRMVRQQIEFPDQEHTTRTDDMIICSRTSLEIQCIIGYCSVGVAIPASGLPYSYMSWSGHSRREACKNVVSPCAASTFTTQNAGGTTVAFLVVLLAPIHMSSSCILGMIGRAINQRAGTALMAVLYCIVSRWLQH